MLEGFGGVEGLALKLGSHVQRGLGEEEGRRDNYAARAARYVHKLSNNDNDSNNNDRQR